MSSTYKQSLILELVDKWSKNSEKIEKSAKKLEERFKKTAEKMAAISTKMSAMGKSMSKSWFTLGIGAALSLSFKQAIQFEDKMIELHRVTGGTAEEFNKIRKSVTAISPKLAMTLEDTSDLYKGLPLIGAKTIEDYERLAQEINSIKYVIGLEHNDIIGVYDFLKTNEGYTDAKVKLLFEAVEFLRNNNTATDPKDMIKVVMETVGDLQPFNLAPQMKAMWSDILIQYTGSASKAISAQKRMSRMLSSEIKRGNKQAAALFKDLQADFGGTINKMVQVYAKLSPEEQAKRIAQDWGPAGSELNALFTNLTKNAGGLLSLFGRISSEAQITGTVANKFAEVQNSISFQAKQAQAELDVLSTEFGDNIYPVMRDLMRDVLLPFGRWLGDFAKEHPKWLKFFAYAAGFIVILGPIMVTLASIFSVIGSSVAFLNYALETGFLAGTLMMKNYKATGSVLKALIAPAKVAVKWLGQFGIGKALIGIVRGIGFVSKAIWAFLSSNPFGWVVLAIAGIVALITYFDKWGVIIEWLKKLWYGFVDVMKFVFSKMLDGLKMMTDNPIIKWLLGKAGVDTKSINLTLDEIKSNLNSTTESKVDVTVQIESDKGVKIKNQRVTGSKGTNLNLGPNMVPGSG